ncbi:MAG: hypothetical protein QT03_C0001G0066 [archaeon GW2011_AR10]|uniref:Helix-turn-helix domain-containing protein n=1 Tax=Candidatus Iainarchaeum sp. TaxID=3101447 RepID=A0A7J4IU10_9ARCH|nr:MAG: hypothetical protein QT03_C0001G0066 [archaeon GW2011_AR10]HIH08274.1 helix-turn-helix domain-containing protein [Candidatus Diapherotrites archaeon]
MHKAKKADEEKIKAIKKALKSRPDGLWIRELARASGLDKSTVSRYMSSYLASETQQEFLGRNKIIRLK